MAGLFASRAVPTALVPSSFFTVVATRTYLSPFFTKMRGRAAVLLLHSVNEISGGLRVAEVKVAALNLWCAELRSFSLQSRHRGLDVVSFSSMPTARYQSDKADA